MRRTLILISSASLLAAGCSSSDSPSSEAAATTVADTAAEAPDVSDDTPGRSSGPTKPTDINWPGEAPTELVVTELTPGSGPIAETGDTVIVDYIGVRALDGVEFDNSYDRDTPFSVGPLGTAPVIDGWNEGLTGTQAGERLQLDIPSSLAYGATARSEVIREDEPLTFVIDVRSVIKASNPEDAPTEPGVEPSQGATELSFEDLREGDGAVLEQGQTAVFELVLFRADNGVLLDSTWDSQPIELPMATGGFPGIVDGMPGMRVGGRRAITAPPALGFGPDGNPQIGLPANTDIVLVVDLLGAY